MEGQPGPCCLAAASVGQQSGCLLRHNCWGWDLVHWPPPTLLTRGTCPALFSLGLPIFSLEKKVQPRGHCPDKKRPGRQVGTSPLSTREWRRAQLLFLHSFGAGEALFRLGKTHIQSQDLPDCALLRKSHSAGSLFLFLAGGTPKNPLYCHIAFCVGS